MREFAMTAAVVATTLSAGLAGAPSRAPVKSRPLTTAQIAARSRAAVVTIETTNAAGGNVALGSGFIARADGFVVTNWHVMAGAAAATVTLASGEVFRRVTFLDGDPGTDDALLKIPGSGLPVLTMTTELPAVGTRAVAVGSPLGLKDTVTEGIVSAVRVVLGRELVQTTTPIAAGSSGGPLIDAAGRVFAISTMMLDGSPEMNFGVPAKYALGFIRDGLPERPLTDVFQPAPSPASSPAPSLPSRIAKARPDLTGSYVVSRARAAAGPPVAASLLVAGRDVGLLRTGDRVEPTRVLRTSDSGEVAFAVGDAAFAGYQTEQGFVYFDAGGDTVRAVRLPQPLASDIGTYIATSHSMPESGDTGHAIDWVGEAAVIADAARVAIAMRLIDDAGDARSIAVQGPLDDHGRFSLGAPGGSLEGHVTAGVLQADWCTPAPDGARRCIVVDARRR